MERVLVAYVTNAGSTAEVAELIGRELGQSGPDGPAVDVLPIKRVRSLELYDAVVVGGPMTIGWHREAQRFLKDNERALQRVPVALFLTALSLTVTPESAVGSVPVFVDPSLAKPPRRSGRLSLHEGFTTVRHYLEPVLKKAPSVVPVSIAFFGGKLDYARLSLPKRLFVQVVIRGKAGDFRDWEAIRAWTSELRPRLLKPMPVEVLR
jgi:menaquinone-dependent protoporphyrinogen oxidase